jgi:hypothetical protein
MLFYGRGFVLPLLVIPAKAGIQGFHVSFCTLHFALFGSTLCLPPSAYYRITTIFLVFTQLPAVRR